MIESFVHGSDAATTLAAVAEVMRPGGVLIVCDDLPTDDLLAMTTDADGSSGDPAGALPLLPVLIPPPPLRGSAAALPSFARGGTSTRLSLLPALKRSPTATVLSWSVPWI